MRSAFTLIELLVVITIIVVLLALLTPALDRAIYQAELAVCGANLRAIAMSASVYAAAEKRKWPWREQVTENDNVKPNNLSQRNEDSVFSGFADLPRFMAYFDVNGVFNDPLNDDTDWEGSQPGSSMELDYWVWFGWQWTLNGPHRGMFKVGDRFSYTNPRTGASYRWNLLAGDYDHSFDDGGSHHSHADHDGVMQLFTYQDEVSDFAVFTTTLSRWASDATPRGPVDTNMVYDDGGVRRFTDEKWDEIDDYNAVDGRFVGAPVTDSGTLDPSLWINMPKP